MSKDMEAMSDLTTYKLALTEFLVTHAWRKIGILNTTQEQLVQPVVNKAKTENKQKWIKAEVGFATHSWTGIQLLEMLLKDAFS